MILAAFVFPSTPSPQLPTANADPWTSKLSPSSSIRWDPYALRSPLTFVKAYGKLQGLFTASRYLMLFVLRDISIGSVGVTVVPVAKRIEF